MFATDPPAHLAFPDHGIEEDPNVFFPPAEIELKSELLPIARSCLNKRASTRGLLTTVCAPHCQVLFLLFLFPGFQISAYC